MFERFTEDARQVVVLAQENARRLHHQHIGTEHLLLALLERPDTTPSGRALRRHGLDHARAVAALTRILGPRGGELDAEALDAIGIDLDAVREKVEAAFGPGALDRDPFNDKRGRSGGGRVPLTSRAKKVLELSLREAIALKHKHISDCHVLLGILRENGGLAAKILADAGIDFAALRREISAES